MAVFRVEKNANYTTMSNHHLKDHGLSLKAKGLLSQFLSLPDSWHYNVKGLVTINKDGKAAIETALWELEQCGYVQRRQLRDENGRMSGVEYTIYEVPQTPEAGEYIGEVVTSGYCNCSICCGKWAGGATASGVYPTANHTIAVDAIVPIGTQIIMNGVLYTVEDTGNFARYGVDFDVYYDSHSAALAHGHQTWQAYYAGGDGESIEVTTTETVKVCYVTLTVTDFESILTQNWKEATLILSLDVLVQPGRYLPLSERSTAYECEL